MIAEESKIKTNTMRKKISDEQLEKELKENNKTQKEIAYEYGYGHPSRTLSDRIKDLGFKSRQTVNFQDSGGALVYLNPGVAESLQLEEPAYFQIESVEESEITLSFHGQKWRHQDE